MPAREHQAAAPTAGEQLTLGEMPRRLFRATPTRLVSWLECPRRYRFTYLDRPTPPKGFPWAHNSVGASIHTALAAWWRLPVERRTPDEAGALLYRGWRPEGFRDELQSERWRAYARKLVEEYVATLDPHDEPVGVERTVAMTTPRLALSGRIDRLDERPRETSDGDGDGGSGSDDDSDETERRFATELVVVDYKTGRRALTTADARGSLALAVYAAAAARTLRRPCRRVELHHLPSGTIVSYAHTPESLARHLRRADELGEEVADADAAYADLDPDGREERFPPRPGPLCQWCDFAQHCPEGRAAYPTRRSWEGLDPEI